MSAVSDDFNRADGSPGSNWQDMTWGLTITSNVLRYSAATWATSNMRWADTVSFLNDQYAQCNVGCDGGWSAAPLAYNNRAGVLVRGSGNSVATGKWYMNIVGNSGVANAMIIVKCTAENTYTQLGSDGDAPLNPALINIKAQATILEAGYDGDAYITTEDSSLTSGSPGVGSYWPAGSGNSQPYWDNFLAYDIAYFLPIKN